MDYETGPPPEDPEAGLTAGWCASIATLAQDRAALEPDEEATA